MYSLLYDHEHEYIFFANYPLNFDHLVLFHSAAYSLSSLLSASFPLSTFSSLPISIVSFFVVLLHLYLLLFSFLEQTLFCLFFVMSRGIDNWAGLILV